MGSTYGVQWVGPSGGTGDQRQAVQFTLAYGQAVTAPVIELDRAGTITGRVTSETGRPIEWGAMDFVTGHGGDGGANIPLDTEGRYRIDSLGPYDWPLFFGAKDHATQWSGGTADRFAAQTVHVTSGATTTYDYTMRVGTVVTGTVKARNGSPSEGFVNALHAQTGDYVGQEWAYDGAYQLRVLGPVVVKFSHYPRAGGEVWYGGRSFADGRQFTVPAGGAALDFCVVNNHTMRLCRAPVPRRTTDPGVSEPAPRRTIGPAAGAPAPRRPVA
jgi:hypothetical protein